MIKENLNLLLIRKNTEIIDDSFTIFKQNWKLLSKFIFKYLLPIYILTSIFTVYIIKSYINFIIDYANLSETFNSSPANFIEQINIPFLVVSIIIYLIAFMTIATIFDTVLIRYVALYRDTPYSSITDNAMKEQFKSWFLHVLKRNFQFILVVTLIYVIYFATLFSVQYIPQMAITFIGVYMFYYIFALIWPILFIAYSTVVANEKLAFIKTLKRTFWLLQNNWLSAAGLFYLTVMIAYIISIFMTIPTGVITGIGVALDINEATSKIGTTAIYCIAAILMILYYFTYVVLPTLSFSIKYWQLREKKEGLSLKEAVDNIK
ncbi:MAG: hypothetical protein JXK07_01455 [Spirochaetes bacterium]|nr:hypothetical protein [Spirochaetota bacterium]MBN2769185.1 hypothetical protein [Spirochaetota bacterium]